jgi:outer membrane protein assembly factor BamB
MCASCWACIWEAAFSTSTAPVAYNTEVGSQLYQFKTNGEEGIDPPPAAVDRTRNLIVSFGEQGNGPRQFNSPSGVAYFDEIVYVADTGNNRIARYKLTTDFE